MQKMRDIMRDIKMLAGEYPSFRSSAKALAALQDGMSEIVTDIGRSQGSQPQSPEAVA